MRQGHPVKSVHVNKGNRHRYKVLPDLEKLLVPIESVTIDDHNARTHGAASLRSIRSSLRLYGQHKPAVVSKDGMVVRIGNGMVQAAKELGWTHIAAVVVDEPEEKAKARAIADNRTAELSFWDTDELEVQLRDLGDIIDLSDMGWDDLAAATPEDQGTPPLVTEELTTKRKKKVFHLTYDTEAAEEFEQLSLELRGSMGAIKLEEALLILMREHRAVGHRPGD